MKLNRPIAMRIRQLGIFAIAIAIFSTAWFKTSAGASTDNLIPSANDGGIAQFANIASLEAQRGVGGSSEEPLLESTSSFGDCSTVVINTADSGAGSLREAINCANTNAGLDTVSFTIPSNDANCDGSGVCTIRPVTALPPSTGPVIIDGLTQPGASNATWPLTLKIVISYVESSPGGANGIHISGGGSTVRGLVINNFQDFGAVGGAGIYLDSNNNTITSNYLGTNVEGSFPGFSFENEYGVRIVNGSNNTIGGVTPSLRNLASNNDEAGVRIDGLSSSGNIVLGNYLGTNAAGTAALRNRDNGVAIRDGSNNIIGGADHDAGICNKSCNLISGNGQQGVYIDERVSPQPGTANNITIQGNFIGTDITGLLKIKNNDGISFEKNSSGHIIGGLSDPGVCSKACNLISGNDGQGIEMDSSGLTDFTIQGNFIGTNIHGTANLGNFRAGIDVDGDNAVIGSSVPGRGNLVSGNSNSGIDLNGCDNCVVQGNLIGVAIDGVSPLGNIQDGIEITGSNTLIGGVDPGEANIIAFNQRSGISHGIINIPNTGNRYWRNSIHSNGILGIDFVTGAFAITPNDPSDADVGPNNLQNFPVLTAATSDGASGVTIQGTLNSNANTLFTLEFFGNPTCDASGNAEGRTFLGSTQATTGADNNVTFGQTFSAVVPVGHFVTATATHSDGSTSEFSACRVVTQGMQPTPTPTATPTSTPTATPTATPQATGRIAFESNRDGGGPEIYTMDPDGTNVLQLTNNAGSSDHPTFNPDGSRIVFHSFRDGGSSEIYIMNADGSAQTRLTNDAQGDLDATISSTGVIAFEKACDIYKINANGTNQVRLTETAACDSKPAISPDGTRIAWVTLAGGANQIFRMNSDGSNIVQLTNPPGFNSFPSFSPDGTKITFTSGRDGNNEIYVMNEDGSNQTRLTNNSTLEQDPVFSPDGSRIAFWTTRDGNSEVYTMNADGMNQSRLTNNAFNDVEPSWGPVGGATPTPTATPTNTPTATPTNTPTSTPTATPTATPTPGAGFEGDVAPRANPDGFILATDVTQLRRFAAGLDTLNPAVNELQRADCAPRTTFGDGNLNSSDVVQGRRYAAGLDPLTPAEGPIARPTLTEGISALVDELYGYFFGREMRIGEAVWISRTTISVPIEITPYGDEVAASFTLEYDPAVLTDPRVELVEGAMQDSVLTFNASKAGRLGVLIDSDKAMIASAMPTRIVMVTFDVIGEFEGGTRLLLTDEVAARSVSDAEGNPLSVTYGGEKLVGPRNQKY